MDNANSDLIADFIVENLEHLGDIERHLLAMESDASGVDPDAIHDIFRKVHSIKGVAGFLSLESIADLAHHLESVLNVMRSDRVMVTQHVINRLLPSFDLLKKLVLASEQDDPCDISSNVTDLENLLAQLKNSNGAPEAVPGEIPASVLCREPATPTREMPIPVPSESQKVTSETSAESTSQESPTKKNSKAAAADATIRVPVAILDRLMNLTGELVLGRNQLIQMIARKSFGNLPTLGFRLDQITSDLQESIMYARMQPVGTVFNRFPRLVRDLNQKLRKDCQLLIEGGEVELDKTILENIADPLTHLIRNSLDHGVEMPETRVKNGKQPQGTLRMQAFHQGGKVHLTLSDDGAGIDAAKIREKAVRKGLISADQAANMSVRDSTHLIFHPGFSTAETVTEVSGRGVGMDVVKTNIEKLGGTVEVESTVGVGTTVHLTLPLTLAIIPSLIISSGSERFAIPENSIVELVRVTPHDRSMRIERFGDKEALQLRGSLLPLVRLSELLGVKPLTQDNKSKKTKRRSAKRAIRIDRPQGDATMNVVVVEGGIARYGLIVDAVIDPEQIVVKPLGAQLKECRCLAGMTVLGDGNVAFILDVAGIASSTLTTGSRSASVVEEKKHATSGEDDRQSILMLGNGQGDLFAVPMAMVARIERIERNQIERVGSELLLQYRGTTLPLMELHPTSPASTTESLYVVVFMLGGQEVAIIALQLIDIRDVTSAVQPSVSRENGVTGTMILDGKIVRMLDLYDMAEKRVPASTNRSARRTPSRKTRASILLAEDSPFFREQVVKFLESEGHQVTSCENGLEAWEQLESGHESYDLLVTDLEMPKMNGLELCRHVRQSSQWEQLPVIMLTSMSEPHHVLEGKLAGVSDYQLKMDRVRLLASVSTLLRKYAVVQQ